jgi:regulator of protease activity HflC (stomatin/prohibitin superfamily)
VEIKDVEIPEAMQRAMAREAEAERERRAKVINARGELQAADELTQAAETMSRSPAALQLRYLQTLLELGADQNSTVVFPLPIDIMGAFLDKLGGPGRQATSAPPSDASSVPSVNGKTAT